MNALRRIADSLAHLAAHTPLQDGPRVEVAAHVAALHTLAGEAEGSVARHPLHDDLERLNPGGAGAVDAASGPEGGADQF